MNACPRAWAISYGTAAHGWRTGNAPATTPPRTFDQLLTRTMRAVWMKRLEDQYQRKIWSLPYAKQTLDAAVDDAMDVVNMSVPRVHLDIGKERSKAQLRLLERTQTLRPLFTGEPRRWAYFDRRMSATVGGVEVYAAPDVAVFHHHRWTLVRVQFRSSQRSMLSQQLEHLLMVHWAMNQPGLPNSFEAYSVKVVRWGGRGWMEHSVNVSKQLLSQSVALMNHDVQEMLWLKRWAGADPSYASLPLAAHHEHRTSCRYRPECPARDGLAKAKHDQERTFAVSHYNEATKSAKTA